MLVTFQSHHFLGAPRQRARAGLPWPCHCPHKQATDELPSQPFDEIYDSSTTTQIQKHCLSRLLVVCVLNDSKMSCLLSSLFQFFF
jgi:hypothetical protein